MYRRVRRFARPLPLRALSRWTVGALVALLLLAVAPPASAQGTARGMVAGTVIDDSTAAGEPSALSGWYARNRASGTLEGLVGTRTKGRVVLEFLANQAAVDTVGVFSGEQRGDSLVGAFTGVPGRVVFLKRPSQSQ